jgi:uracil-DNA glycosylase
VADRVALLAAIAAEIKEHRPCGSEPCETCTNLVPGEGNPYADVVLVGEAPGATEDQAGRPFVGRCGRLLDDLLEAAGISREDVYITNVLKARPPGNRDPRAAEVAHNWPWLAAELHVIAPRLVVPVGRHALRRFTPGVTISQCHGRLLDSRGRRLFPMFHPSAGLRSPDIRRALFEDARALRLAVRTPR